MINERVRLLRKHLGLSQAQFSLLLHCTMPYISMLESGKSIPSDRFIDEICEVFHVRDAWLRNGEEPMFQSGYEVSAYSPDQIGERIRLIRQELNLSQANMAKKVGCSKEHIYAVETSRVHPSRAWLTKVATTCGISLSWLISGNGNMRQKNTELEISEENLIQYLQDHQDVQTRLVTLLKEDPKLLLFSQNTDK